MAEPFEMNRQQNLEYNDQCMDPCNDLITDFNDPFMRSDIHNLNSHLNACLNGKVSDMVSDQSSSSNQNLDQQILDIAHQPHMISEADNSTEMLYKIVNPTEAVPNNIIETGEYEQIDVANPLTSSKNQSPHVITSISPVPERSDIENSEVADTSQSIVTDDLVKKRNVASTNSKKRRRIVVDDGDSDDENENELKRQLLQDSPETSVIKSGNDADSEDSSAESDDVSVNPEVLRARSLLKNVIIIKGPDTRKRKSRVLDSDEEIDELQTSVDDIGLIPNDIEDMIEEKAFNDDKNNFDLFDLNETVVPIENPILPQEESPCKKSEQDEKPLEDCDALATPNDQTEPMEDCKEQTDKIILEENDNFMDNLHLDASKIPMASDDNFVNESDEDFTSNLISNEEYFGTPDAQKPKLKPQKRGPKPGIKRNKNKTSVQKKRLNKYEKDFVEDSSGSDDLTYSESLSSSSESSREIPVRRPSTNLKPSKNIVHSNFTITKIPVKRKVLKKDRFYDRSQDIPADIYFGDVKVPLHVLHTRWSSDEESEPEKVSNFVSTKSNNCPPKSNKTRQEIFTIQDDDDDPRLCNLKEFLRIAGIKINYAKLFNGVRLTNDKCSMLRRILMQKGLQGEPTIAKCKQLRLELQAKRESAELDKSVIIRAEGRTRRSTRGISSQSNLSLLPSTSGAIVQPETLQTLSKIRRVVDSDSE